MLKRFDRPDEDIRAEALDRIVQLAPFIVRELAVAICGECYRVIQGRRLIHLSSRRKFTEVTREQLLPFFGAGVGL